jgi:uracil-DNA glycosylase
VSLISSHHGSGSSPADRHPCSLDLRRDNGPGALSLPQEWRSFLSPSTLEAFDAAARQLLRPSSHPEQSEKSMPVFYPPLAELLSAFELSPPQSVRVIILGQDPYHGPGQAHGLAFSVPHQTPIPPSLRNIFKELADDLGISPPRQGSLVGWAKQGVFLLNSVLSVRPGQAGSHQKLGWQAFTDGVIKDLSAKNQTAVFIFWGSYAQEKASHVDTSKHLILSSAHPSPLSAYRGFFGSRPFTQTNKFLKSRGLTPINWDIPTAR